MANKKNKKPEYVTRKRIIAIDISFDDLESVEEAFQEVLDEIQKSIKKGYEMDEDVESNVKFEIALKENMD